MDWKNESLQKKSGLLDEIHAIEPNLRFDAGRDIIETQPIPFYPDGTLVRCKKSGVGDYLWYVKLKGQEIVCLDGSVANIHHLNVHAPLRLTGALLPAYLKFRLYFGLENRHRRYLLQQKGPDEFIFQEEGKVCAGRFKISPHGETTLLEKQEQPAIQPLAALPVFEFNH